MELDNIWKLETVTEQIEQLKKRATAAPDIDELINDWDPLKHDVMNPEKRPNGKKLRKEEWLDDKGVTHPAEYDVDPVNRIPLAIEQDQVNIHTAFTVGNEPRLNCEPLGAEEKELFEVVKRIGKKNKLKYLNKKIVRSWLSEQEAAEYWYLVKDESFWTKLTSKIKSAFGVKTKAVMKLKSTIWSPFRGDKLYPLFNIHGDLVAFSREYKVEGDSGTVITKFMTITSTHVKTWVQNSDWGVDTANTFAHKLPKLPVIYSYRSESLCKNIKPIRARLEKLISNYADCIDYNFFPRVVVEGAMTGLPTKDKDVIQMENGGKVFYLTWNQTPESAKFEFEFLMERAYSMTNSPRLSIENLQGLGQVPSGSAFKFLFMGILLAVDNHAEVIGEHIQRRCNFLVSATGAINTAYKSASETLDIEAEIVPFTIDNMAERIKNAVDAHTGGVASKKTGVILAGLVEDYEAELKAVEGAVVE